jgi:hypothetical protein
VVNAIETIASHVDVNCFMQVLPFTEVAIWSSWNNLYLYMILATAIQREYVLTAATYTYERCQ